MTPSRGKPGVVYHYRQRVRHFERRSLCGFHCPETAGAIHAALFLQEFVKPKVEWAHFDLYAWNPSARPGRPVGGEAFVLRGLFHMLSGRYGR